jgi:two-component system sensor histidine kinase KdpD
MRLNFVWVSSNNRWFGYLVGIGGVGIVALLSWPFYPHIRPLTAAMGALVVVLMVSLKWGTGPALMASILSAAYVNFYYVPPVMKLQFRLIQDDSSMVALIAYLVTSILVGQLSGRAQLKAQEVQRLYNELRAAIDHASQLEAIKQSERLKSALLDTVTHDLRTPLTSIKAAATALRDLRNVREPGPRAAEREDQMLRIIVNQSDRLNHFIQGMIELAKIEASGGEPVRDSRIVLMDEIIAAALSRADEALRFHRVSVQCEEDLIINTRPQAIAQVLFSLLENAALYSPGGTEIGVVARKTADETIEVSVEDRGPGIPEHLKMRIFEKFFRHEQNGKGGNPPVGLGLGLAIACGIIEAHGGRIWVEDRAAGEQGSRFIFAVRSDRINELDYMSKVSKS